MKTTSCFRDGMVFLKAPMRWLLARSELLMFQNFTTVYFLLRLFGHSQVHSPGDRAKSLFSLWNLLGSCKFRRRLLDVERAQALEAGPGAVFRLEIGQDGLREGITGLSCRLRLLNACSQCRKVVAKRFHVLRTGHITMTRDKGSFGMHGCHSVERFDPCRSGGIDQIGNALIPCQVTGEDDVRIWNVDRGIAASVSGQIGDSHQA